MSVECPTCKFRQLELLEAEGTVRCQCDTYTHKGTFQYFRFPAYNKHLTVIHAEDVHADGEATCYNHPTKAAEAACDSCGRFACALCLVDASEGKVCLNCYSRNQQTSGQTENKRTVHDSVALAMALVPLLVVYLTIITAPITLFLVLRYWRRHPCSEVPRTRIRFILAFIIALLQVIGWVVLFTILYMNKSS